MPAELVVRWPRILVGGAVDVSESLLIDTALLGDGPATLAVGPDARGVLAGLASALLHGTSVLLKRTLELDEGVAAGLGVGGVFHEGMLSLRTCGAAPNAHAPTIYIPTSGTTGTPKLAAHTMSALAGRIRTDVDGADQARWLLTYHPASFAGVQVALTALLTGSVLLVPSAQDLGALAEAGLAGKATHVSGTPTLWRSLLSSWERAAPPITQITLGGEAVDQPLLDHLKERFPGARIVHIYASTEAGALFAVKDGQEGFPASWLTKGPDGVGLRIVDGVLEVASPRAMLGYALEDASPQEWVRTGDLVEVRGDRVHYIGREDSMINVGGAKVLPEEVERVAAEVPGVREVYVFGKRSPILGQIVAMQVVIEGGYDAEQVRTSLGHMLPNRLPAYKVPRIIQFVDGIEATETGKKERRANG